MLKRKVLCLYLLAASACAADSTPAQLDAIFSPLAGEHSPGMAVLVRQNGRTLFRRGYGVRDLRTLAAIDAGTNFRLASCTKQFTAMATMLLVHDGKLRYDSAVTDVFAGFPAYGRTITVRNLLTHTSGLPDYEDLMEAREKSTGPIWTPTHQIQDAEVLDLLQQQTHGNFAPGTRWTYSNSGYVLLGLIVAKVSGEPFESFLQDRIFEPLHMSHTLVYVEGVNTVPDRAYGHSRKLRGEFVESDQSATSATQGDGGIYSNLDDLAKWDDALHGNRLLKAADMAAALDPVKLLDGSATHWPAQPDGDNLAPGKPVSYGFGWFLDPYAGRARMWHSGSTMGFRTLIERFPKEGISIVILCNRTDLDAAALALKAVGAMLGKQGGAP